MAKEKRSCKYFERCGGDSCANCKSYEKKPLISGKRKVVYFNDDNDARKNK